MSDQRMLFTDRYSCRRPLPVIGERSDIRYYGREARSVLNNPESTGMGFWSINPYIGCAFGCTYCYARYTHRYATERELSAIDPDTGSELRDQLTELPAWLAFERRIFVKRNAADVLRNALRPGSATLRALTGGGATLVIGTATDPYQPAERTFRVTRALLDVIAGHRNLRLVIITKSALIARDVDLLGRIARRSRVTVHLSLITLDRELARRLEPRAPTPESRLRALSRLAEAGVDVGINVMPVLPGITDHPAALSALVRRVAAAGATHINAGSLRLQAAARVRFLPFIQEAYPELAPRYRATYGEHANAGERYRAGLKAFFTRECRRAGIRFGRSDDESVTPAPADTPPQMEFALVSGGVE